MPPILWRVRTGDILDEVADVLVCSANPFLTLSGGVGGALLLRYGPSLQSELNDYLAREGRRFVEPMSVIVTKPMGTPYRAVLHAVAVNGLYESSPKIVTETIKTALSKAAAIGARHVALTALATGYGKLTMNEFGRGLVDVLEEEFSPIEQVTIIVRGSDDANQIHQTAEKINLA